MKKTDFQTFYINLLFFFHPMCFMFGLVYVFLGDCLDQRVFHLRFCDIVLFEDFAQLASRSSSTVNHIQRHITQHKWSLSCPGWGNPFNRKPINVHNNNDDNHHHSSAFLLNKPIQSIRGMQIFLKLEQSCRRLLMHNSQVRRHNSFWYMRKSYKISNRMTISTFLFLPHGKKCFSEKFNREFILSSAPHDSTTTPILLLNLFQIVCVE